MGDISANFNRNEFECRCGCGFNTVDVELIKVLEDIRMNYDVPITINSGCRCDTYNKKIGGATHSQHKLGRAADIVLSGISPLEVAKYLREAYRGSYGVGEYNSFTHIDTRDAEARWKY